MTMVSLIARRREYPAADQFPGIRVAARAGLNAFWPLLTPFIIIGGILSGVFTLRKLQELQWFTQQFYACS